MPEARDLGSLQHRRPDRVPTFRWLSALLLTVDPAGPVRGSRFGADGLAPQFHRVRIRLLAHHGRQCLSHGRNDPSPDLRIRW